MEYLVQNPLEFHNIDNDDGFIERLRETSISQDASTFWSQFYERNTLFCDSDVRVYDNIIPEAICSQLKKHMAPANIPWKYGYCNEPITLMPENVAPANCSQNNKVNSTQSSEVKCIDELHMFSCNLYKNPFFEALFYQCILPHIDMKYKESAIIDRCFVTGQLHGVSHLYHKDQRSSVYYGPSVYVFLNPKWKSYYDGSLSFILNQITFETLHVEPNFGRVVVFEPDMYHKSAEVSGYALFENAMQTILQYHLVYKETHETHETHETQ